MTSTEEQRERSRARFKQYYAKNREAIRERDRLRYHENLGEYRENGRRHQLKRRQQRRVLVLTHYSGPTPECACCGERTDIFLTIDHVNEDGAEHRRRIGARSGSDIYSWLIKNDYPDGFQVLCFNCNWAKSRGGCPHLRTLFEKRPPLWEEEDGDA